VVIVDGVIDQPATGALRAKLIEQRGEIKLFDHGGSIEEIKARCLQETHLPAPITPTFQKTKS
jgi:N-methylhydantoinase B